MEMTALAWILTYAIHSTVLIAAVWLVTKLFPRVPLRLQESLWRAALFGGLLTATVHQVADVTPLPGRLDVPAALDSSPVATASAPAIDPDPVVRRSITQHDAGDVRITTVQQSKPQVAIAAAPVTTRTPSRWPWVILGLIATGAIVSLARLGWGARRMSAKLRNRRDVIEDPLLEKFFELCDDAGFKGKTRVRLTASGHLRSPVALLRREVVVPERAVERLTPRQQHAMLAHELHHVTRRDPQWSLLTAVVEALFVFQPLNHLARRKLLDLAEYQCDDWAAKATGDGTQLAKCLAEVASWLEDGQRVSAISVAMADGDSPVVRRITRLLKGKRTKFTNVRPVVRVGSGLGLLGAGVWLMPNVAPASSEQPVENDALQVAAKAPSKVVVTELPAERGERRSAIVIDNDGERVRVEVDRRPPPPPPSPRRSVHRDRIVVHGFYGDSFGFGSGCGSVDVEVDLEDFEAHVGGAFNFGFPFSAPCRGAKSRSKFEAPNDSKWSAQSPHQASPSHGLYDL